MSGARQGVDLWQAIRRAGHSGAPGPEDAAPALVGRFVTAVAAAAAQPLTPAEGRLWWLDRAAAGDPALIVNFGVTVDGPFDPDRLETAAWRMLLDQPSLWLRYPEGPSGPERAPVAAMPSPLVALFDRGDGCTTEREIASIVREQARTPFDLAAGPLFRLTAVRIGPERLLLQAHLHHLAGDFRSLIAMLHGLVAHYGGLLAPASAPPRDRPDAPAKPVARRHRPRDAAPMPDLRPLLPRTDDMGGGRLVGRAGALARRLSGPMVARLAALQQATRASEGAVCLAALRCFLSALTTRRSFAIAVPVDRSGAGDRDRVRYAATPVPVEGAVDLGQSFAALVADTRRQVLRAMRRERPADGDEPVPFSPEILLSYATVFPALPQGGPLRAVRPMPLRRALSDLELAFWFGSVELERDRHLSVEYNAERLDEHAANAVLDAYLGALEALVAAPDQPAGETLAGSLRLPPLDRWTGHRLRLLASFADEPLRRALERWAERLGMPVRVQSAGYGRMLQELLDPASGTRTDRHGATILYLRLEDLVRDRADRADLDRDGLAAVLTALVREQVEAVAAAAGCGARLLLVLCPSHDPRIAGDVADRLSGEIAAALAASAAGFLELRHAAAPGSLRDPAADATAHLPWTEAGDALLAQRGLRRLHEELRDPVKVVVVDADHTLWDGVAAELGPMGVQVRAGHRALQRRLVEAAGRGLLVCICSKNLEADVLAVLDRHPAMILRRTHLVAWRIDWRPKSVNLAELADELGLGLDSFVLLDDNPAEIAAVRAALPEVTAIRVPADPEALEAFAEQLWLVDRSRETAEDGRRTDGYRRELERGRERAAAPSFADFLAGLGLEVAVRVPGLADAGRIAQLTQRTNQFNALRRPWTEADAARSLQDRGLMLRLLDVRDRFGDYGTVGLVAARRAGEVLVAEQFLLSCRALGRGVEAHLVRVLGDLARICGVARIRLPCEHTQRNQPVRRLLDALPATGPPSGEGGVDIATAAALAFDPPVAEPVPVPERAAAPAGGLPARMAPRRDGEAWERLITELSRSERAPLAPVDAAPRMAALAPAGDAEAKLRQLVEALFPARQLDWTIPLGRNGLASLDQARLLARIHDGFGRRVGFAELARDPSLAELARMLAGPAPRPPEPPLDEAQDLVLPRTVVPVLRAGAGADRGPRRILVTGATGFLGGYLVAELLARSDAMIVCLVRARDDAEADRRLRASLRSGGRPATAASTRIEARAGRLEVPGLGLDDGARRALARGLDLVVHAAARVSFAASYAELRAANVLGLRELLALAVAAGGVPVHFVSSLALFDTAEHLGAELVLEDELPEHGAGFAHGYGRSKWVAERNLRTASARGLPVTVHRPGNIVGDSATGFWPPGDTLTGMLRLATLTGAAPVLDLAIDLTPVDFVAAAVAALAVQGGPGSGTLHLAARERTSLASLVGWLGGLGLDLVPTPARAWEARIARLAASQPQDPAAATAALLGTRFGPAGRSFLELAASRPAFDTSRATGLLAPHGLACPAVEAATFGRYVAHLAARGFMVAPKSRAIAS